jgi:hypothetical protein
MVGKMKLAEIIKKLGLKVRCGMTSLDRDVTSGYASDLLSDVIANAKPGDLWVTLQVHQNIVAVGSMKALSGIVLVNSREPAEDTLKKAEEENIPIMVSDLPAFKVIGKLYELGICKC